MLRVRAHPARLRQQLGVALMAAVLTGAVAVWVISPRFGSVTGPSLIDDWVQVYNSPVAVHQLEHWSYDPSVLDAFRYRPAFWVWSYLQWHTLGAPGRMAGPNAWNLLRIGGLALALALMAAVAVHPRRRGEQHWLWLGLLAAVPGLLLLSSPAFGVDLARFGPQEPLLIAAMGLGGMAMLFAGWLLLERRARTVVAGLVGFVGLLLWIFGVYMKEAAICVFALAPFLALELRARWDPPPLSRSRIRMVVALGLLALAPLLDLTVQLLHVAQGPRLVYGAAPPHGLGPWLTRIGATISQQWNGIPVFFAPAWLWQGLPILLPVGLLVVWLRTHRPPWLALGMLLLGWSMLVFQGLPKVVDPRYYMPVFATFAIALVVLLAEVPRAVRGAALVGILVFAASGVISARRSVQAWAAGERVGNQLVQIAAQLNPQRCPVYYAGFDLEMRSSLPTLLAVLHRDTGAPCLPDQASLIEGPLPIPVREPIIAACAAPGWRPQIAAGLGTIFSCARLSKTPVRMPDGSRLPLSRLLPEYRLTLPRSAPVSVPVER